MGLKAQYKSSSFCPPHFFFEKLKMRYFSQELCSLISIVVPHGVSNKDIHGSNLHLQLSMYIKKKWYILVIKKKKIYAMVYFKGISMVNSILD